MELGTYSDQQRHPLTAVPSATPPAQSLNNAGLFGPTRPDGGNVSPHFAHDVTTSQGVDSAFSNRTPFSPYGVNYAGRSTAYGGQYAFSNESHRKKWVFRLVVLGLTICVALMTLWLFTGETPVGVLKTPFEHELKAGCNTRLEPMCMAYNYPKSLEEEELLLEDFDTSTGNLLFRSDLPIHRTNSTTSWFAYDALIHLMRKKAAAANVTFPEKYKLLVFPLLWSHLWHFERCEFAEEACWAATNPQLGTLTHWPLYGDPLSPYKLAVGKRDEMALKLLEWQTDKLNEKVEHLHDLIHVKSPDVSLLVLFHCHSGKDRTGELAAAYGMRWLNRTLLDVWTENKVLHQDVTQDINAMMWYCLFLEKALSNTKVKCFDIYKAADSAYKFADDFQNRTYTGESEQLPLPPVTVLKNLREADSREKRVTVAHAKNGKDGGGTSVALPVERNVV